MNGSAFAELRIQSSEKAKVLDKSEIKEMKKVASLLYNQKQSIHFE